MPLQIGAPDVAFPRLNALSFWLFCLRRADRRSAASSPRVVRRPSAVRSLAAVRRDQLAQRRLGPVDRRVHLGGGLGTILGAVNFITTIFCACCWHDHVPMPIFTWNVLSRACWR